MRLKYINEASPELSEKDDSLKEDAWVDLNSPF
ncbi:hypothetical protein FOLKNPGA_00484 [Legionella sp. PC1000]|nr:hypothetical protein FOLKNPGA_00484 [Legionella sp. PC1000]